MTLGGIEGTANGTEARCHVTDTPVCHDNSARPGDRDARKLGQVRAATTRDVDVQRVLCLVVLLLMIVSVVYAWIGISNMRVHELSPAECRGSKTIGPGQARMRPR
jgi:hypothetical protein